MSDSQKSVIITDRFHPVLFPRMKCSELLTNERLTEPVIVICHYLDNLYILALPTHLPWRLNALELRYTKHGLDEGKTIWFNTSKQHIDIVMLYSSINIIVT